MQRGNHEFFNSPHGRPSAQPTPERRREAAPKPGIQVLARPKEEEKKPVVIATRPSASVEVMSREKTGVQTIPKILPSPREQPTEKEMLDSRKLIGDGMYFEDNFLEFLTDNPHFSVTAAIGPQNAGKSTILSMLAGNNPQDKYRYYVFRPASREAVESSRYQTVKIHAYVSKTRGIFLDCQATNSCSMVEDYTRYSRKIDDKAEITAYVEISHTVLVVSDYTLDLELVKILRTAEMIRANYNRLSSTPPLNLLRKTNIVFVHTRAGSIDFHYPVHRERVLLIRSLFSDSTRLRISDNDDLVLMMLSVLKPRKDTTTLMHAPPQIERILDTEEIVHFDEGIRQMRLLLAGIPRDPFSEQSFTEKQWYSLAETIWKDNGFLNAIHRLSNALS